LEGWQFRAPICRLQEAAPQQQRRVPRMISETLVDYSSDLDLPHGSVHI
jgi:hypothetical protein